MPLPVLPQDSHFPPWLRVKIPKGGEFFKTQQIVEDFGLNTVCEEAKCPNRGECFSRKTATFLALGKQCTRNCGFCDIDFSKAPQPLAADEPERIATATQKLGLKHVVITMVARDDLPDFGAEQIALIVEAVRLKNPGITIEVLTSDFSGDLVALDHVLATRPDVFNHNIETVRRLSPRVRHKATYERTLSVLQHASKQAPLVKSGLMVGLGETKEEVFATLQDLRDVGCNIITIGQYLQASLRKLRVQQFIHPDQFKEYEEYGKTLGILEMYCGPFVRSSYHAGEVQESAKANLSI